MAVEQCRYCGAVDDICRSTREMEESNDRECYDALMRAGGGEYSVNRAESERRCLVFDNWKKER